MPLPIAIAAIEAGAAVLGAVGGTLASASGGSGVNVGKCEVHYPNELAEDQFVDDRQSVQWDVIRFHADGEIWNNDLAVAATGYLSMNTDPLVGRTDSQHPNVPANRFIRLNLDKSSQSEDMSGGELTVNIDLWGGGKTAVAEGNPADPWVALHVHGRFDPRGVGDIEYGFKLKFNSFGLVLLDDVSFSGTAYDVKIWQPVANTVSVYLDQGGLIV